MIINFNKKSKFKLSDRICFKLFSPQTEILEFAGDIVFYPILFKFLKKTESDCQTKSAIALKFKEMKKIFITREPGGTSGLLCVR